MKTKILRKFSSLVLAFAVLFTTVMAAAPADAAVVRAPGKTVKGESATLASKSGTASAGEEVQVPFAVEQKGKVQIAVWVNKPVSTQTALYTGDRKLVEDKNNPETFPADAYYDRTDKYAENPYVRSETWSTLQPGNYIQVYTFAEPVTYEVYVTQPDVPELNRDKTVITKGFTQKLSVSGGKVEKWSSDNKKIASVDQKGKVTAKKKGKAAITATLTNGNTLTCVVTVKENRYTDEKLTSSSVASDKYGRKAYSAYFDKKGNLVVKVIIVNGGTGIITGIPDFKVTVYDQNGKKAGSYKKKLFKVHVGNYGEKTYKITIKKSSKLSAQKVDLRNSIIKTEGGTATVY